MNERGPRLWLSGPFSPVGCEDFHGMGVELLLQSGRSDPSAPEARIHHLHQATVATPDDDEVGISVGQEHDGEGGKNFGTWQQHMVDRHQDLFRFQPQLDRDLLKSVDGRAVDVGLTGFAQAAVAHRNTEALKETLECSRTAIHGGGLDDLGNQETAIDQGTALRARQARRSPGGIRLCLSHGGRERLEKPSPLPPQGYRAGHAAREREWKAPLPRPAPPGSCRSGSHWRLWPPWR